MIVLRNVDEIKRKTNPVVTIGTFDGIHLGHQKIFQHLEEKKKRYAGTSYLITFEPHPQLVLKSRDNSIQILTTLSEKLEILAQFPLDYVLVMPFTPGLSKMTGEHFIEEILLDRIGMIDVVIGYDHAFGYRRSGNIDTLRQYSATHGYQVNVIEPFLLDDTVVKSTVIRQMLLQGDVDTASQFLGRSYRVSGKVVTGKGRGKGLSFPTANLLPEDPHKLIPGNGIYAAQIFINHKRFNGAVSVGVRPTFNETEQIIEAYLFDFDQEIYNEKITIAFIQKLRNEEKFSSVEKLTAQMQVDVDNAKKLLQHR